MENIDKCIKTAKNTAFIKEKLEHCVKNHCNPHKDLCNSLCLFFVLEESQNLEKNCKRSFK